MDGFGKPEELDLAKVPQVVFSDDIGDDLYHHIGELYLNRLPGAHSEAGQTEKSSLSLGFGHIICIQKDRLEGQLHADFIAMAVDRELFGVDKIAVSGNLVDVFPEIEHGASHLSFAFLGQVLVLHPVWNVESRTGCCNDDSLGME